MLVWQDMPQAFGDNFSDATKAQWMTEWKQKMTQFYNHPSIIVWTTFNEGWGESSFDVPAVVALTKKMDSTRLVNNASAWKTGPAPFGHGLGGINTDWSDTPGDIWIRRTVTLPQDIPAKLNVVTLHDEDVEIYINGVLAASATGYTSDYAALPMSDAARAALKPGANVIAVHCHQTTGGQGVDVGIVEAK